jgi:hypothetical protein
LNFQTEIGVTAGHAIESVGPLIRDAGTYLACISSSEGTMVERVQQKRNSRQASSQHRIRKKKSLSTATPLAIARGFAFVQRKTPEYARDHQTSPWRGLARRPEHNPSACGQDR